MESTVEQEKIRRFNIGSWEEEDGSTVCGANNNKEERMLMYVYSWFIQCIGVCHGR